MEILNTVYKIMTSLTASNSLPQFVVIESAELI